jgi:protein O-GlcNAc transferase
MPLPHNPDMQNGNAPAQEQDALQSAGTADHGAWMLRGTELHSAGQLEQALIAFENALALAPQDVNTASACATLLSLLDRPQAAYKTLLSVEAQLMQNADGATNLAIAAEACGDLVKAQAAYTQALQLDPAQVRSLNNVGILAANAAQWELAIGLARKCAELQPGHAPHHANLSEFLAGDGRYAEALEVVASAMLQFPDDIDLKIRHTALLAFHGELEKSDAALAHLNTDERRFFEEFLAKLETAQSLQTSSRGNPSRPSPATLDALDIHVRQALRKISICDWRGNEKLSTLVRQALAGTAGTGQGRNWHDAPFCGLTLDMREDELRQMRSESITAMRTGQTPSLPPFIPRSNASGEKKDQRIHVGFALQSLRHTRQVQALARQLASHDASRFAFHVYAFTPQPAPHLGDALRPFTQSVGELGHMLDAEAAARIRLDRLDIYVEMEGDFGWSRAMIAAYRVAPLQLRQLGWHLHHVPSHWDYTLSDSFIHPEARDVAASGAVVRLPHSCWLATREGTLSAQASSSWEEAGLPAEAFVLGSFAPPVMLDSTSFALWMKILRSLPDAVLWLPYCGAAAANLVREAQAAGVSASRLFFSAQVIPHETLANPQHADLLLDTLRVSFTPGLEDALYTGVPALSCAGTTMASRLGASLLRTANLPELVLESSEAYVAKALQLGRDSNALEQLRTHIQTTLPASPLFDMAARVREREAAWEAMVQRSRAGLEPAAIDVPPSASPVSAFSL